MTNFKVNDIINVIVTGVEKYGVFVKVNDEYDGLIHISEISYNYVKNIYDFVNIGEEIKAKIISIDDDEKQIKLSIKDIEYKIIDKNKIKETSKGFTTLKLNLNSWIEDKKKELLQHENN